MCVCGGGGGGGGGNRCVCVGGGGGGGGGAICMLTYIFENLVCYTCKRVGLIFFDKSLAAFLEHWSNYGLSPTLPF